MSGDLQNVPLRDAVAFALWRDESSQSASRLRTFEQWLDEAEETRERWRRASDAALSAIAEAGYCVKEGWQPIETAPKGDGSRNHEGYTYGPYILGGTDYGVLRLRWWDGNRDGESKYCNFLGDCGNAYYPTHWMPLPQPPQKA